MATPALNRILYVEDEPDIQAVAKIALEAIGGFTLEVCACGADALARGAAFSPDLILMDVMMPGMDGPTTLQELRKIPSLQTTPAIFMTAKVHPSEIDELKQSGAVDVIPKPFDPLTLAEKINAIWSTCHT